MDGIPPTLIKSLIRALEMKKLMVGSASSIVGPTHNSN